MAKFGIKRLFSLYFNSLLYKMMEHSFDVSKLCDFPTHDLRRPHLRF